MNTPAIAPRWHVLGTGSMACLWAAYLSMAGHAVTLIARHGGARAVYQGISLDTAAGSGEYGATIEARGDDSRIARLLVCTKAFEVLPALEGVAPRLDGRSRVVLLQNGMGFHDAARAAVAPARVFCALSTEGAHRIAPFHVRHAGRGITLIGEYDNPRRHAAARLRSELPHQRLRIRALADIAPALWRKLAINCAINALTAVHDCRNGALLQQPALHAEFDALCVEIATVLAATGHAALAATLPRDAARVAQATAANRSSMLQDASAGRRTEIDHINGFLVRVATRAGVPCPLNRALCERVQAREPACV